MDAERNKMIFHFKPVEKSQRSLVHRWLTLPHVAEWFYGKGLKNTLNHLDAFFEGLSLSHYWLAYDQEIPFAFLITSSVNKPDDELTRWCVAKGPAITLDMLIGDLRYLGQGIAHNVIRQFLESQFPHVEEVLIDPEKTNQRAIHVYQKAGFARVDTFIPSHSPHPHLMMRLIK